MVFDSALSSVSAMFRPLAKDSVTVASRPARFPPDAVTSYTAEAVTLVTASVAVVPPMAKSAASTFFTFLLNVMRHFRLSALVGDDDGVWRSMDVTVGICTLREPSTLCPDCVFIASWRRLRSIWLNRVRM